MSAGHRARGVVFEEYDLPGLKIVDGIAEVAGNYPSKGGVGELAAWFKDSEGNLIGSEDLREIASQPMLLYLLARMHGAGKPVPLNFKGEAGGARYHVYKEILDWVSQRQIGKGSDERLRRFLQLAGLATQQSGQRVLHWKFLQKTLEESGAAIDPNERDAKAYGTILSFAFTSRDQPPIERVFAELEDALTVNFELSPLAEVQARLNVNSVEDLLALSPKVVLKVIEGLEREVILSMRLTVGLK